MPNPRTPTNVSKPKTISMPKEGRTIINTTRSQAVPSAPPQDSNEEGPHLPSMGLGRKMPNPTRPMPPPPPYDVPRPGNLARNNYYNTPK